MDCARSTGGRRQAIRGFGQLPRERWREWLWGPARDMRPRYHARACGRGDGALDIFRCAPRKRPVPVVCTGVWLRLHGASYLQSLRQWHSGAPRALRIVGLRLLRRLRRLAQAANGWPRTRAEFWGNFRAVPIRGGGSSESLAELPSALRRAHACCRVSWKCYSHRRHCTRLLVCCAFLRVTPGCPTRAWHTASGRSPRHAHDV